MNRHTYSESKQNTLSDDYNRSAELDELDFSDDEPSPSFGEFEAEDDLSASNNELDLTDVDQLEDGVTDDDLAPETLIHEDGSRSPHEFGDDIPRDQTFTIVDEREIGAGYGLDEAELARVNPLDGKPWDGDPSERLTSAPSLSEDFVVLDDDASDLDEDEQ